MKSCRGGWNIRPLCFFLLCLVLLGGSMQAQSLYVQSNAAKSYSYGIDPRRDSVAFEEMRQRMAQIREQRPTVAVVLSGGGAKGAAEISVLRHLDELGIPVDLVVGTSIGGLLGGLYACGYSGEEMERLMRQMDWDYLLSDSYPRRHNSLDQKDYDRKYQLSIPFGPHGLAEAGAKNTTTGPKLDGIVQGRNVSNLFSSLLIGYEDERDFLKLPIPFICIAADMVSAQPKIWHCGRLSDALRSTMSIPGLFSPVKVNGMVLMDGGLRSNFPAELARQLGADIIIGVDISTPALGAERLNNLIDFVMQATDVMGRETYLAGVAEADLYIKPEVDDFTIISFDSASIATLIERGNEAVKRHAADFDSLRARIGYVAPRRGFRKAINLIDRPVIIADVHYNGVSDDELPRLKHLFRPGQMVTKRQLDNTVAMLMGTRAFQNVTYELLGRTGPYLLQFNCQRAPVNQMSASARFDNFDFASLQLHMGLNSQALHGSRWDFTARIGLKSMIEAEYNYRMRKGWDVGGNVSLQSVYNGRFCIEPYDFLISFMRGRADAFLAWQPSNRSRLSMGLRMDYFRHFAVMADYALVDAVFNEFPKSDFHPSAYVTLRSDSYDDPYFPKHGAQFYVAGRYYLAGLLHGETNFYALHASMSTVWNANEVSVIPFADGRYVSQAVQPYVNMLSVGQPNNILDQQIPFVGISQPELSLNLLTTAGVKVRYNPANRHYISATVQVLHESNSFGGFVDADESNSHLGAGLEYAYQTRMGPLRAGLHWTTITHSVGLRLCMGLDF